MRALRTMVMALAFVLPWTARAEDPFLDFISPVTDPTNFEDPRPTTEARPIYIYHRIGREEFGKAVGLNGGDVHIVALQLRLALSERFSLMATKDGYVWLRPKNELPGVLETKNGWANVGFGMKYAVYRDPERRAMGTIGLRYEAPSGDKDVLQGKVFPSTIRDGSGNVVIRSDRGAGVMNPFVSGLWGINNLHLMGYVGGRIPIEGVDSTFLDVSVHADYRWQTPLGVFFPLFEMNWVQTLDDGRRAPLNQEGFDFFNIGSSEADNKGVVTMAGGARYRIADRVPVTSDRFLMIDLGAAYEYAVVGRDGIFDWRVTSDLIFRLI